LVEGTNVSVNQIVATIDNKQNIISTNNATEQLKITKYNTTDNAPLLQQINANIEAAKEKLSQDVIQEKRYQELYNQSSVTKVELEKMQLSTKTSKANLAALQQQYKSVQQQNQQQYITQANAVKSNTFNQDNNIVKIVSAGKVYKKVKQVGDYVRRGDVIAVSCERKFIICKIKCR
jgi:multidrug resistance efflux pump